MLCGFGCHLEAEPNRIQRLLMSDNPIHRNIHKWGMQLQNKGVTYEDAFLHCNIPTR